ncbi:MAG TPA: YihY/virulence factor BrkB family protein [Bdellovibrionales bacterium]|nr:YihY/virulence factor BrkB family protein [Bdellovibrionales bacterium]
MPFYKRNEAKTFFGKISRDALQDHAASLTFTSILALIPMIAIAYALFTAFGGLEKVKGQFQGFIAANLAPAFAEQVLGYVNSIQEKISPEALGVFGLLGFIVTSVLMLDKVESAFNLIWGAVKPRPLVRRFTNYWALLSLGPVLIITSVVLTGQAMSWLQSDNGDVASALLFVLGLVGPYLMSVVLFFALFYMLPNAGIHRRDALLAAGLTAFVFELAKQGYAVYANYALSNSVYGSLAILPVFFLWIYVIWMITLLGFEYCCYLEAKRMKWNYADDEEFTLDTILLLDIMEVMAHFQTEGKGAELKDLVRHLTVNRRVILKHLEFLKEQGVIVEVETNKRDCHIYHLAFSRDSLNHRKLLEALEQVRFKPVGPITRAVAHLQNQVLKGWSLNPAKAAPQAGVKPGEEPAAVRDSSLDH